MEPIFAGALVSVDSYMNLQLVNTEEYIDSKLQGLLGEVLIRYGCIMPIFKRLLPARLTHWVVLQV